MSLTQIFPSLFPSFFSLVRSLHCSYITVARLDRSVCYCPSLSPASTLSYSSTQLFTLTNCLSPDAVAPTLSCLHHCCPKSSYPFHPTRVRTMSL
ncbi:hypothetical protein ES332_D02G190500v1 [Gossypium tomentosum]|uniref:Uncharacterized protein n=1 Tax=Gossypium tomentosum TaxID=34277 RepID=A0A5D2LYY9_GOSTO|nr:hypothetical protein ES332_D02G190500v1 [Gossypium tomentosum]